MEESNNLPDGVCLNCHKECDYRENLLLMSYGYCNECVSNAVTEYNTLVRNMNQNNRRILETIFSELEVSIDLS